MLYFVSFDRICNVYASRISKKRAVTNIVRLYLITPKIVFKANVFRFTVPDTKNNSLHFKPKLRKRLMTGYSWHYYILKSNEVVKHIQEKPPNSIHVTKCFKYIEQSCINGIKNDLVCWQTILVYKRYCFGNVYHFPCFCFLLTHGGLTIWCHNATMNEPQS